MKKFLLYAVTIVIYSVVVVLLRHSDVTIPSWVLWALSLLLIVVLRWIRNIGKDHAEEAHSPNTAKEEGRYYFYNDRCSFRLPKEEIMRCEIEKDGLKHILSTLHMMTVIIEIRTCMPNFDSSVPT